MIKSILIDGVEITSYTCKKCINSSSGPGSSECHVCPANSYFSKLEVIVL